MRKNKYKKIEQLINEDHLDFTIAQIVINKFQEDDEPAKYINRLAKKYINDNGKFFDLEPDHFRQVVDHVCASIFGYQMDSILDIAKKQIK